MNKINLKMVKIMGFFWFTLAGLSAGVLAGMGMGGGTLLIPILSIIMGVELRQAQLFNLLVFLPMAVVTIIIYIRKKLINFKAFLLVSIPAIFVSVFGAILSFRMTVRVVRVIFGTFLIILAFVNICLIFRKNNKRNFKN